MLYEPGRRLPEMVSSAHGYACFTNERLASSLTVSSSRKPPPGSGAFHSTPCSMPVDLALELDADALVAPGIAVGAGHGRLQLDRPGDALQGQLSLDPVGGDEGAAEGGLRVALDVEEVGRLQVAVALLVEGVGAAGVDGAADARLLPALQRRLELEEASADRWRSSCGER